MSKLSLFELGLIVAILAVVAIALARTVFQ